jgi:hypothetical protein
MLKRINANIITALCTSCAMIAFAFYERHGASGSVPEVAFWAAAAGISLLPVLFCLVRCRIGRS